jgi:2-polyprenyl-6-methoxyphenol hydroxylase-like FAD-dependent oxidoreductase
VDDHRKLNIAVCGCGPAGLAAALLLHRRGHRVRVFERFESPRPVGSGLLLQPTGLGVLKHLGLFDAITQLGAPIDRLFGRISSGRVVLDVSYSALGKGWQALAVHLAALFRTLHDAAIAEGVEFIYSAQISRAEHDPNGSAIVTTDALHGGFDLIVDAAGANSPLIANNRRRKILAYGALWVNVPRPVEWPGASNALEQRYHRAMQMAGVLPIGRRTSEESELCAFFWSLRRDQFNTWRTGGMEAWKASVARLWPEAVELLKPVTEIEQVTFAQYDHFTARVPYSDRLVHIGDSAHATSPQLGQGANMALLDAMALALALDRNTSLPAALQAYARMRYWHIRTFQAASAMFTPFYQSDSRALPWLRDWLAGPLSNLPVGRQILARLVSGMTVAPIAGATFESARITRTAPSEM